MILNDKRLAFPKNLKLAVMSCKLGPPSSKVMTKVTPLNFLPRDWCNLKDTYDQYNTLIVNTVPDNNLIVKTTLKQIMENYYGKN